MNPQILQMIMAKMRSGGTGGGPIPQAGFGGQAQQGGAGIQNWNNFNPQIPQMIAGQYGGAQQQGQGGSGGMASMLPMILQMMRQKQGGGGGINPQTQSLLQNNMGSGNPLSLYGN